MIHRRVGLCNPGRLKMQINHGRRGKSIFTGIKVLVLMCIFLFYLGDFRICEDVDKKVEFVVYSAKAISISKFSNFLKTAELAI